MQITFILILLGTFVAAEAAVNVPLIRVKSMRQRMMEKGTWNDYLKYKKERLKELEKNSRGTGDLPQKDYDDLIYVGLVQVGTPLQNFTVVPDTGSSNFWVPDSSCGYTPPVSCDSFCPWVEDHWPDVCLQVCGSDQCCQNKKNRSNPGFATKVDACDTKHKYNSSLSSSYKANGQPFSIQYGTGSCDGFLGQDTIKFAGITIQNAVFAQASHLADFFGQQPFDGILGLGFDTISEDGVTPVFDYMVNQGLLDAPVMGVWMKHDAVEGDIAGDLMLGGYDSSKFTGTVYYTPITEKGYWQFNMDSISVNGQTVNAPDGTWAVISDTGTSLVIGPNDAIDKIGTQLGGQYDPFQGLYFIDCGATGLGDVTFTIGGHDFPVTQINYVVNLGQNQCVLGFEGLGFGASIDWILGEVFIREWYQIYDKTQGQEQVGFARAVK